MSTPLMKANTILARCCNYSLGLVAHLYITVCSGCVRLKDTIITNILKHLVFSSVLTVTSKK